MRGRACAARRAFPFGRSLPRPDPAAPRVHHGGAVGTVAQRRAGSGDLHHVSPTSHLVLCGSLLVLRSGERRGGGRAGRVGAIRHGATAKAKAVAARVGRGGLSAGWGARRGPGTIRALFLLGVERWDGRPPRAQFLWRQVAKQRDVRVRVPRLAPAARRWANVSSHGNRGLRRPGGAHAFDAAR